jgi:putative lipoprotein
MKTTPAQTHSMITHLFLITALLSAASAGAAEQNITEVIESARTSGANFVALGNQPDWHLAVYNRDYKVTFVTDAGAASYHFPATSPVLLRDLKPKATIYNIVSDTNAMRVVVLEKFCQDTKTGKAFGTTVEVDLDGREYYGCGEAIYPPAADESM